MRTSALPLITSALFLAACTGGDGAPRAPAATGALALVQVGAATRLYHAAPSDPGSGNARVAVYDAAAAGGGSGFLKFIDLGVPGIARTVGADGTEVVVTDEVARSVYFVDATTDTVRGTAALPEDAQPIVASGGPSLTSGVAVDSTTRKAYVSVSYGVIEYDLGSRALTRIFHVPRPENFALDRETQRLFVPYYLCDLTFPDGPDVCSAYPADRGPAITDGLTVVDLATGRTWQLVDPASPTPRSPLGLEADAAVIDPALGLAVIAVERIDPSSNVLLPGLQVLRLGGATYDDASATCRMPAVQVGFPDIAYTDLANDLVTHLAVAAQEHGDGVAFVDLAQAAGGMAEPLVVQLPARPGGSTFINWGDPHGIAIGQVGGRPSLFLVSDDRATIARVDLLGVQQVMAGHGAFADHVTYFDTGLP